MKQLEGRTAVITGAGSGIGRSIAHALARAGTRIVVSDISVESAESVRTEVEALGVEAIAVAANVAERDDIVALAEAAYERFGSVDILVNNAGVTWRPFRTVVGATLSDWKFLFDVNVWGVVHGLDVFLPRMAKQPGEKHVVNTSSLAGVIPVAGHTPYSATKAAVTAISEGMAQELADKGFGVTVLHPGVVRTNVVANSEKQRKSADRAENRSFDVFENTRLKRLFGDTIEPEAVGEMVRDAIQRNQLYLHTHPIPDDIVVERQNLVYGRGTFGRA